MKRIKAQGGLRKREKEEERETEGGVGFSFLRCVSTWRVKEVKWQRRNAAMGRGNVTRTRNEGKTSEALCSRGTQDNSLCDLKTLLFGRRPSAQWRRNVTVKTLVIYTLCPYSIRETIMGGCVANLSPPPSPPFLSRNDHDDFSSGRRFSSSASSEFIHTPFFFCFAFSFRFLD